MKNKKSFAFLIFSQIIMAAGFALSLPFLAVYLNAHRGLPMSVIGLFMASSVFFTSFAQTMGGEFSDRLGRKKIMIIALLGRGLSTLVIAFLILFGGNPYLILLAHMAGIFIGALYAPAADSWIADFTAPADRVKAYGLMRMGINIGWAIGPALGGMMVMKSYPKMFFFTFLSLLVCVAVVAFFVGDSEISCNSEGGVSLKAVSDALSDKKFFTFCVYVLTISVVISQLIVSNSLYAVKYMGLNEAQVGMLFSVNGLMVVFFQYLLVKLMGNFRITTALSSGSLFYAAGYFIFGYAADFKTAVLAVVVFTVGEIILTPNLQTLAANMAPSRHKGRHMGIMGLFRQVGHSCGILVGAGSIHFISPRFQQGPWYIIAAIALASAAGFYGLRTRLKDSENGGKAKIFNPVESAEKPRTV